eukprot:m.110773 g.110773  ORF g.110773 m.110773 type:complete len:704 (-) comp12903_c0_seq1:23-2134(-)
MHTLVLGVLACWVSSGLGDILTVSSDRKFALSPLLHSIFFETEINFGSEGGLYAELICNRDFETQGRGRLPPTPGVQAEQEGRRTSLGRITGHRLSGLDPGEPPANVASFAPWAPLGDITVSTDNTRHPFSTNPVSLRLTTPAVNSTTDAGDATLGGVRNPGYWGINVKPGASWNFSFYVLADGIKEVQVALVDESGELASLESVIDVTSAQGSWVQLTAMISTPTTCPLCTNNGMLEFRLRGSGTVNIDAVSLVPSDAVGGLWRKDIFDKVSALRPGFIRMPGGNYLEGTGQRTRWNWKKTLGQREARPGHYNTAWGYWVTDAVGIHELLLLCEAVNAAPQLSAYTGYSMGQKYVPLNESGIFAQDAVDLVEYVVGDSETPYGRRRAAAGHPTPFASDTTLRLEVGNEERAMNPDDYPGHYRLITQAVWSQHPNLTVVASGRWGPPIEGSPCLTGQRCDAWDDHYYRTPDVMAGMGHEYDSYNRSLPTVFVGEFAANVGHNKTLRAAVAEAVFMLGFEANGDVVKSASFAPMLNNVNGTQWDYDLINFCSDRLYTLPSYTMQLMLREAAGDVLLASSLKGSAGGASTITMATASTQGNDIIIKLAAYIDTLTNLTIQLPAAIAAAQLPQTAIIQQLTSEFGPDATNTLDRPNAVTPTSAAVNISRDYSLVVQVPPWSVTIVRIVGAVTFAHEEGSSAPTSQQ